jgi:hypothetical protein
MKHKPRFYNDIVQGVLEQGFPQMESIIAVRCGTAGHYSRPLPTVILELLESLSSTVPIYRKAKRKIPKELIKEALLGGEEMAELVLNRGLLEIYPESFEAGEGLVHAAQSGMIRVVKPLLERGVRLK